MRQAILVVGGLSVISMVLQQQRAYASGTQLCNICPRCQESLCHINGAQIGGPKDNGNVGHGNTGTANIGNGNVGSYNVGNGNTGRNDIGNGNTGSNFVGDPIPGVDCEHPSSSQVLMRALTNSQMMQLTLGLSLDITNSGHHGKYNSQR